MSRKYLAEAGQYLKYGNRSCKRIYKNRKGKILDLQFMGKGIVWIITFKFLQSVVQCPHGDWQ